MMCRVPKPRPPASYAALPCTVLALDPGASSGWAVLVAGEWHRSGVLPPGTSHRRRVGVVEIAKRASDLPLVVVAEKWPLRVSGGARWRPSGAPRESWGMWLAALAEAGVPKRRIVRVQVGRWSAAILGNRQLKTEVRRARGVALAKARFGLDVEHDEGAALCVGMWASRAGEVACVLPKPRGQRTAKGSIPVQSGAR